MLFEPLLQLVADDVLDDWADFGGDQLVLGLAREFGVGDLHREHAGEAFARILARERDLLALEDTGSLGVGRDLARQCGAKAREMRATVALRDVVGKWKD